MIKKLFMLVLLGVVVAIAVPSTRARLVTPIADSIKVKIVPRKLDVIADRLAASQARGEGLPAQQALAGWIRRNAVGSTSDPWGNPYFLDPQRDGFVVGSIGPDGVKGTPDDFSERRRTAR